MNRLIIAALCCGLAVLLVGCGTKKAPKTAANTGPVMPTVAPPPPPPPPPPQMEEVKAEVGVGKKGRSLDQYEGAVVTPAKSLFAAKERLVFEVQVPHALNLFQGSEGRLPKSHEEFMEKIIQFNQIPLPQLPEGHRYKYDPATGELMVERPKVN